MRADGDFAVIDGPESVTMDHKEVFAEDKAFIFYCSLGWRSAMATDRAREMGLPNICHIGGGFTAWKEAGNPIAERKRKS